MLHAVSSVILIAILTMWIGYETKRRVSLARHAGWIVAVVAVQLAASIISYIVGGNTGNFILHTVGGGVASTLMFIYLSKTFDLAVPWRLEIVMLFAFVSSLGVLNELTEYFIEAVFGILMSLDSRDTWRDFVANTSGALIAWLLIKLYFVYKPSKKKRGSS